MNPAAQHEDMHGVADALNRTLTPPPAGRHEPPARHAARVAQILRAHGYSGSVVTAGLLHHALECYRPAFTERDLLTVGAPSRVVALVGFVTRTRFDPTASLALAGLDRAARERARERAWAWMIERLDAANDPDAWAIRLADLLDNLSGREGWRGARAEALRAVQAPMTLALSAPSLSATSLWRATLRAWGGSLDVALPGAAAQYRRLLH